MIIILLISALVSFVMAKIENNNNYIDSIIILIIVVLNAIIGVIQESKAEKSIDALQKLVNTNTLVIRNAQERLIKSELLVPGDIILLNAGDYVPADIRLIDCYNLKVKEDALTGESMPVSKNPDALFSENTPVSEQKNILFSGSYVTLGRAVGVVVKTGMHTHMGSIANLINTETTPQTPLQKSLAKTGKYLGIAALAICVIVFILGFLQGSNPLEIFMIAISLAVAAIPEGLPAVVTIVLAMGVSKLATNKAIIRKLPAVETLGSADVICSDKTGTLTQNKMTVMEVSDFKEKLNPKDETTKIILILGTLCNNAKLLRDSKGFSSLGDPTEEAIIIACANLGQLKPDLDKLFVRIGEKPFDSSTKLMSTIHTTPTGLFRVVSKGAPEILANKCSLFLNKGKVTKLTNFERQTIRKQNEKMASKALRVIAVAYKDTSVKPTDTDIYSDMIFVGLIGMLDPPRKEAQRAVKDCKLAGIKPVMITGDYVVTAKAIAKELDIYTGKDKALTGTELNAMSDEELQKEIYNYSVFARVTPEHKVRIVKAFQKNDAVVAMTGDGVNDAPALKVADIGCAMGKNGTEVAKEASDMILTDDNFSTIVSAVKEGRGIFENIRKTIHFLISSNIGEIITVLSAFLLNLPSPLSAIQLLWINLVTDSFPALALGTEPVEKDIMRKKQDKKNKGKLFTKQMIIEFAIEGSFIGAIAMLAFTIGRCYFGDGENIATGRTMAFCVLSLSQLVHAFNVRSDKSIFKIGVTSNKNLILSFLVCAILQISVVTVAPLASIFKAVPLDFIQWAIVIALSLSPLIIVEIEKLFFNRK